MNQPQPPKSTRIDPRLTDAGFAKLMARMGMPDPEPPRPKGEGKKP